MSSRGDGGLEEPAPEGEVEDGEAANRHQVEPGDEEVEGRAGRETTPPPDDGGGPGRPLTIPPPEEVAGDAVRDPLDLEDPWNLVRLALGSLAGEPWRIKKALACPSEASQLRPPPDGMSWWEQYQRTQNFDGFRRSIPFRPNTTNNCVDLVLVGDEDQIGQVLHLDQIVAHMEAFLCLRVALRAEAMDVGAWAQPRASADGCEQVGAHFLLTRLEGGSDMRSTCTLGLTSLDLYPPRRFDFVTGMTDAVHRVGLFSFARYYEDQRKEEMSKLAEVELRREISICMVKALCRESLKLCGLQECHLMECLMNPFSGSKPEGVNRLPLELCCLCLRKLHWATQADLLDRHARLPAVLAGWFGSETARLWERMRSVGLPTYATESTPNPLLRIRAI